MARDMSGCGHLDQDNCSDGRRVAIIIDLRQGRGRVNAEQCDHDTQRGQASSSWRARLRHTTTTSTNHPHQDRSHTDTRFHQPAADHLAFSFRLLKPPTISKTQKYARATSPCISPPPAEGGPGHQLLHTVQEQLCTM